MCDPAKRVLTALYAKGMDFDMPTLEFPAPIPLHIDRPGSMPGDAFVRQLVVKAAVLEVAGVPRPAIVLTGQNETGAVLPQWLYPGDDDELGRAAKLVKDMTTLAINSAAKARQAPGGGQ